MDYKIRKANRDDIEELLEMSRRITNHNNREFLPAERVDVFLASEFFVSEIADNVNEIYVLMVEDKIIGMCRFEENILVSLMVDFNYQGTGAAGYFVKKILDEKFKGYKEIELECFKANGRARRFYEKNGFVLVKEYWDSDMEQDMCVYMLTHSDI